MSTSINPKITKSKVQIKYESDDGYQSNEIFPAKHGVLPPENPLLSGLGELARLTALFGFEDEAKKRFDEARERVRVWRESRGNS